MRMTVNFAFLLILFFNITEDVTAFSSFYTLTPKHDMTYLAVKIDILVAPNL